MNVENRFNNKAVEKSVKVDNCSLFPLFNAPHLTVSTWNYFIAWLNPDFGDYCQVFIRYQYNEMCKKVVFYG
jgi:hypothetical protein